MSFPHLSTTLSSPSPSPPSTTSTTSPPPDNPKTSGLYPSNRGYGVAIWFGIITGAIAGFLIVGMLIWSLWGWVERRGRRARRRRQTRVDNWWKRNFGTTPQDGGGPGNREQGVELQSMRYPWGVVTKRGRRGD
ncbi:hypothetical protein G7Y79_00044g080010 [Physcia stellaris]|nr:hypothetical protein G7Y79_00044g080010 [Physcia stellaris]